MTRWLVTGGAGYIGAHVAHAMLDAGFEVTVLDDLSSGHRSFVPDAARFVEGSLLDPAALAAAFAGGIDGVVHLAGYKYAGESVAHPTHTYRQNVSATADLLDAMRAAGTTRMVFSSSAGVYGTPDVEQVTEQTATRPESPYGETKLIGEWMLDDERRRAATDGGSFAGVALRYFNVIGSGAHGIRDTSPHNIVPKVLAALEGGRTPQIFGDRYPTPDGTCVRDYVHVDDIALAHVAAARALDARVPLEHVYNLGSGSGASNREVMASIARATGDAFEPVIAPPRPGDPARIVADGALAARDLGWRMRHSLDDMIASAVAAWRA